MKFNTIELEVLVMKLINTYLSYKKKKICGKMNVGKTKRTVDEVKRRYQDITKIFLYLYIESSSEVQPPSSNPPRAAVTPLESQKGPEDIDLELLREQKKQVCSPSDNCKGDANGVILGTGSHARHLSHCHSLQTDGQCIICPDNGC